MLFCIKSISLLYMIFLNNLLQTESSDISSIIAGFNVIILLKKLERFLKFCVLLDFYSFAQTDLSVWLNVH